MSNIKKFPRDISIMIVDDFGGMRRILREILYAIGYEKVTEARCGPEALEKLRENPCSVIISDWSMPNMSGLELHSHLKKDPNLSKVPFLLITAKAEKIDVVEAADAGVQHYMIKPFSAEALQDKLSAIIDKEVGPVSS